MVSHLKQWWATHVTWVSAVVVFMSPSIMQWISQHPGKSTAVAALWGMILHWLPSPVKN